MAEILLLDDFIDYQLVGVNSAFINSVQFIFNLNKTFNCGFKRLKDFDIIINQEEFLFSTYHWYDVFNKLDYYIIKNFPSKKEIKNNEVNLSELFQANFPLITNYKNCNYILKIANWDDDKIILPFEENDFINKIEIEKIENIKDAYRLIF